jgi:hypothetical protein
MADVYNKPLTLDQALAMVDQEVKRATTAFPPYNSAHEGFGVLLEEVDELWDHVKTNQKRRDIDLMRTEAIQVAAVALRFVIDVCTEERGRR